MVVELIMNHKEYVCSVSIPDMYPDDYMKNRHVKKVRAGMSYLQEQTYWNVERTDHISFGAKHAIQEEFHFPFQHSVQRNPHTLW